MKKHFHIFKSLINRSWVTAAILVCLFPIVSSGQATSVNLETTTTSTLSASFNTWTKVDPNITVTANGTITGFRVQISQAYTSGANGDQLRSTVTLPSGVTVSSFNTTTGVLVFNGSTTAANWQTILRGVEFRSTTSTCYALQRRVTFVAGTAFYNPLTEHFYEYVAGTTTWTNSKTAASNRSYFGRVGYLATMSSEAENNFVWRIMANDAWMGASDELSEVNSAKGTTAFASQAAVEGRWHWVTGPEKGTNFSIGNTPSITLVSGQYHKWAPGEPNNSSGEHYGQFYSSNQGQWNDLPNTTLPGYICEYGDMPGDITSSTTILTRSIEISGASSGWISGGDINVCSGSNSTTLTLNNYTGSIVRWESSFDNFFTTGTTISSTSSSITVTNLTKTTYYRAIVNSTSPTTCSNLPTSSVFLSVKPTKAGSIFAANNSICSGGQVELTLSGQQGNVNKWQRSTDNVNWTDISNTTTSLNQTVSSAGTYYYRVQVQTPNCGSAVNSDSKTITVTSGTPPVGGTVSSAVHATATNSGTLTLSGYTGTIVKWQRSINDGVNWTDLVNTTASQSYTNQPDGAMYRAQLQNGTCGFTYSQAGTITVNPFAYSGNIYNSENLAMPGLTVKLFVKLKSATTYTFDQNGITDSNGKFTFSTNYSTNKYDFRIVVDGMTFAGPLLSDAYFFNQKILTQSFNAKDYYRMDVNNNNDLTITDVYLIFYRIATSGTTWPGSIPEYRLFTAAQWSAINTSNSNLKATHQGALSITIDNPTNGGSTNIYCIKTGQKQ
jgi:hypothetical protein